MTGGKRLTEEERIELLDCISAIWLGDSHDAYMHARAILERDDEPEFCTCGVGSKNYYHYFQVKPGDRILSKLCSNCGKPVKGE